MTVKIASHGKDYLFTFYSIQWQWKFCGMPCIYCNFVDPYVKLKEIKKDASFAGYSDSSSMEEPVLFNQFG